MSGVMITVRVKLYATLRDQFPDLRIGEAMGVALPAGATVGQLIQQLALPDGQAKILFVNHVIRGEDHQLEDGDMVAIFPPVGGG
jgi:molybdopterin synthase sulfur carrier subunit